MTTATKNMYEIMFLISQSTAAYLGDALEHIASLFDRSNIETVAMQKWDERRLAYEIDKQKRGVYLLSYVYADPDSIAGFERDCNLSEKIMRVMVLRADHLTEEEARAFDRREDLQTEAKLRAESAAAEEQQAKTTATLGAPEPEQAPEPTPEEPIEAESEEPTQEASE